MRRRLLVLAALAGIAAATAVPLAIWQKTAAGPDTALVEEQTLTDDQRKLLWEIAMDDPSLKAIFAEHPTVTENAVGDLVWGGILVGGSIGFELAERGTVTAEWRTYRLSQGPQEDLGYPQSFSYEGTWEGVSHIRVEVSLAEERVTFIEPLDLVEDGPKLITPEPPELKAEMDARRALGEGAEDYD